MSHVFISHSHKDEDFALAVSAVLKEKGYATFLDTLQLQVGDDFRITLRDGLEDSSALIVLWSKESVESSEVLFEVAYCMGRGVPIFPMICATDAVLPPVMKRM